jgi:uncharacterized protein (DUF58 family)
LLGFAAVNTGNNLLYLVVSSLLGFMAVSGLLGWMNIRGIGVTLHAPDEIYDGLETLVAVHLTNLKRFLPAFLIRVRVSGEQVHFPFVDRAGTSTDAVVVRFRGRGRVSLQQATVSSPFPINFFVRRRTVPLQTCITVFPAPRAHPVPDGPGTKESRGEALAGGIGFWGDVVKIRDYTGSEPLKLIHWRLSARHEELKVKVLNASCETPLFIDVLSLPCESLEQKLQFAAFLVNRAIRSGRQAGLRIGPRQVPPDLTRTHRLRLLTELALYGAH